MRHLAGAVHRDADDDLAAPLALIGGNHQMPRMSHRIDQREGDGHAALHLAVGAFSALVGPLPPAADGFGFGQSPFVGLAVGAHPLLRSVGRIVERGGVGAPVVAQRFVEFGVFVGDVVADAFPVDRLLLLPPAHFAFEPLLLGGELFELLQIDVEALRGGPASDDDLRTDESDGQQQVGDQRNAQSRTVIERPFARILPAVVEGKTQFGPSGLRFGFLRGHRAEDFAQK